MQDGQKELFVIFGNAKTAPTNNAPKTYLTLLALKLAFNEFIFTVYSPIYLMIHLIKFASQTFAKFPHLHFLSYLSHAQSFRQLKGHALF